MLRAERERERERETADATPVSFNYSFFHFVFTIAAMYVCMLTTNWDVIHIGRERERETELMGEAEREWMGEREREGEGGEHYWVDRSVGSVWVKIISGWLAHLLYGWSLVAPLVLKNREFY